MVPINLKLVCMIRVIVYLNREAQAAGQSVLERIVDHDNSLRFPFEETTKVLKTLYGSKSLIVIEYE